MPVLPQLLFNCRKEHKNHSKNCPFISFRKKQSEWNVEDMINMEAKRHEFRSVSRCVILDSLTINSFLFQEFDLIIYMQSFL